MIVMEMRNIFLAVSFSSFDGKGKSNNHSIYDILLSAHNIQYLQIALGNKLNIIYMFSKRNYFQNALFHGQKILTNV